MNRPKLARITAGSDPASVARALDWRGWATTVPAADDSWSAYAWPPVTRNGEIRAAECRLADRLVRAGVLGEQAFDSDGNPCFEILPPSRRGSTHGTCQK